MRAIESRSYQHHEFAYCGRCDEWHVDIVKSPRENEMGEKGLTCSDGFDYEPIFGKEAQQCVFLTTDGFANK